MDPSRPRSTSEKPGQALDVWPCQTSPVTPTLAPCGLIGTEPFTRSLSSSVCASCCSSHLTSANSSKSADHLLFLSLLASRLTSFGEEPFLLTFNTRRRNRYWSAP